MWVVPELFALCQEAHSLAGALPSGGGLFNKSKFGGSTGMDGGGGFGVVIRRRQNVFSFSQKEAIEGFHSQENKARPPLSADHYHMLPVVCWETRASSRKHRDPEH
jgi:hypothetical protein